MPKSSGDYRFDATRKRDGSVVIKGTVIGPPGCEPYLVRAYEARTETRSFRLAFRNNNAQVPFVPHEVEHREPDVPADVDTMKVYLPTEDVFIIRSQAATERLKAGPAVPNDELTVQLENVQLGPGVLDTLGAKLKGYGLRGRLIIGKSHKTGQLYLCQKRYMNRPIVMAVEAWELATPKRAELVATRFDGLRQRAR